MVPRRARNVCAMLVATLAVGCSVWRPLPGAALAHPASERLGHAVVSLSDGTVFELDDATITQDSIIGFGGETRARFAVARRDVVRVDARQPDVKKTFVAGGLVALSILVLYIASVIVLLSGEAT